MGRHFPQAILPAISILIILSLLQLRASKRIDPLTDAQSNTRELSTRNLVRQVQERLLVHTSNKSDYETELDAKVYDTYSRNETLISLYSYSIYGVLHLLFRLGEVGIVLLIGTQVMNGTMSYSLIVEMVTYLWFFWYPLEVAISRFMVINKQHSYYINMHNFAHQASEITN